VISTLIALVEGAVIVLLIVKCSVASQDATDKRTDRADATALQRRWHLAPEHQVDSRPARYVGVRRESPARPQGWDAAMLDEIVDVLHEPGALPKPAPGADDPTVELAAEALAATASGPDQRHPDPMYQSGMTGWTQQQAAVLAADIDRSLAEANRVLDEAVTRYKTRTLGRYLDAAGAR